LTACGSVVVRRCLVDAGCLAIGITKAYVVAADDTPANTTRRRWVRRIAMPMW
jgi:hypothetical protein